jgi:uncharacterized protein with gpF-like domain
MATFSLAQLWRRTANPRRKAASLRPIVAPATFASDLYLSAYKPIVDTWEAALPGIVATYARSLAEIVTDSPADLQAEIGQVDAVNAALVLAVRPRIERWARVVEAWQRRRWRATVLSATKVDLQTMIGPADARMTIETVLERNVALVRSVSDQTREKIADAVFRGLREQLPVPDVGRQIREAAAMARRRAKNIAADQTVKLTASLNEERRRQAGISAWEWVHSEKAHPRPEHQVRNGLLYSDDSEQVGEQAEGKRIRKPPQDRPGQLPFCGCTSRAVLILE